MSAVLLYAVSLALPAVAPFRPDFSDTTYDGAQAFAVGFRALRAGDTSQRDWWVLSAAWLANPAIWAAVVAAGCGRWRAAGVAGGCGVVLALGVLPWLAWVVAGQPGYWAWVGSAGLVLGASVVVRRRSRVPNAVGQVAPAPGDDRGTGPGCGAHGPSTGGPT